MFDTVMPRKVLLSTVGIGNVAKVSLSTDSIAFAGNGQESWGVMSSIYGMIVIDVSEVVAGRVGACPGRPSAVARSTARQKEAIGTGAGTCIVNVFFFGYMNVLFFFCVFFVCFVCVR
jgi:hypothetical protein